MSEDSSERGQAASTKTWDAALYDDKHAFVWKYGAGALEWLAPRPGERILDLGCGTAHLTAQIAAAGAEIVGIDTSPEMIVQARASYPDLHFEEADGADFAFAEPFDAVFSNAALHWMTQPERVAACVWRALKPGGRFVAEFGGKGNMRAVSAAVAEAAAAAGCAVSSEAAIWYFPSIGEYAALLERQGLSVTSALLFDRPTPLESGAEGLRLWLEMFGSPFFVGLSAAQRGEIVRRVEERLRPAYYRDGVWTAPYRRLRITAQKDAAL